MFLLRLQTFTCKWTVRGDGYWSPTCQPASINSEAKPLYCLSAHQHIHRLQNDTTTGRPAATWIPPLPFQNVSGRSQASHTSSDSPVSPLAWVCTVSGFTVRSWRVAAAPHHQSPAPAGSTDPLIGPRQTLTPSVQPDKHIIGLAVTPCTADRQLIGGFFPKQIQTDGRLVLWLLLLESFRQLIGCYFPRRRLGERCDWLVLVLLSVSGWRAILLPVGLKKQCIG